MLRRTASRVPTFADATLLEKVAARVWLPVGDLAAKAPVRPFSGRAENRVVPADAGGRRRQGGAAAGT